MLAAVFFVIVLALLTGHYFLVERPRRLADASAAGPLALPLRELITRLPAGIFLQPTFTWGQVRSGGDVEIGVHPMLLSLLGPNPQVEMPSAGEHVEKGQPLMTVGSGERRLVVRSPIGGSVSMANATPPIDTGWQNRSGSDGATGNFGNPSNSEIYSLTGTVDYALTSNLMVRAEVRYDDISKDNGSDDEFWDSADDWKPEQVTAGVEIVYEF